MGAPEVQELVVENELKEFKITTDVEEISGVKGGKISGEDLKAYEKVKYNETSEKTITITPEFGYEIVKVTINGEIQNSENYQKNEENGSYTLLPITNITEDKHIVVTFAKTEEKFVINKRDEDGKLLAGAKFRIEQIEEREEPEDVIGEIVANGKDYPVNRKEKLDITLEKKENAVQQYYFVEKDENGLKYYEPTNGGNKNLSNTTAHSYFEINLQDEKYQGKKYAVVLEAEASSESYDHGYATITTDIVQNYSNTGQFMNISSKIEAKEYTSSVLEGGNTYYLNLWYKKDRSSDYNDDTVRIKNIDIYEVETVQYNFEERETILEQGEAQSHEQVSKKYVSTNKGQASTEATSYIPINLNGKTGKYNITVNAEISSQSSGDYGYATITENNIDRVTYNDNDSTTTRRFIYISGTTTPAENYTIEVDGGKEYRLHLGYYKNGTTDSGNDEFIINNVQVTLSGSELYVNEAVTDAKGQIFLNLTKGKYNITEIEAPEGYEISNPVVMCDTTEKNEVTVTNTKRPKLIVHHYVKGTDEEGQEPTKVAEDEEYFGSSQMKDEKYKEYETRPKMNLDRYELAKGENGEYEMPENYKGTYAPDNLDKDGNIVVTYYYTIRKIPLIVHHYIEGTTTRVPLASGGEAQDMEIEGEEHETYPTNALTSEELDKRYELVVGQENIIATFEYPEVEVTYYYKLKEREVMINKYAEDGQTPLAGAKIAITSLPENEQIPSKVVEVVTNEEGQAKINLELGNYDVTEVEAPEGYARKEGVLEHISINTDSPEQIQIKIINEKPKAKVIVHHYIYSTNMGYTNMQVPLEKGGFVSDQEIEYNIGDMYITNPRQDINKEYKLYEEPDNACGIITEDCIELTYYYIDENINYFDIEINKKDAETKEIIPNVKFEFSYKGKQYIEQNNFKDINVRAINTESEEIEKKHKYTSDGEGKIHIRNLEDEVIYSLKEVEWAKGYVQNEEENEFIVHYRDGKYEVEVLKGNIGNVIVENNVVKMDIYNNPSLKIVKEDQTGNPVRGAKFTITDESGNEVKDGKGQIVGEMEEIEGKQQKVLTTNENGTIGEDLRPGTYVVTEVQAPYGYKMPEDEKQRKQTVVIGNGNAETSAGDTKMIDTYGIFDNIFGTPDNIQITNCSLMKDEKMVIIGEVFNNITIPGNYTVSGEDIDIESTSDYGNAIIILATQEGKVEKVLPIATSENGNSMIINMVENEKNEMIVLGMYIGSIIIPREDTASNTEIILQGEGTMYLPSTFMAKYNREGKVEWIQDVSYLKISVYYLQDIILSSSKDIITIPYYSDEETITISSDKTESGEEITVNNDYGEIVANINNQGKIRNIFTINQDIANDITNFEMLCSSVTSDGIILGGYNDGNITFDETQTVTGKVIELSNTGGRVIIKYNAEGKVEWAKKLGIGYIKETSNGYIALADYQGNLVIPTEETENGEEIRLESIEEQQYVIIEYTTEGKVKFAINISQLNMENLQTISIIENENGYIISGINTDTGNLEYKVITLGSDTILEQAKVVMRNERTIAIVDQKVTKDGSDTIMSKDEEIHYKITYTAKITKYEGNAVITITDTLPYALDEEKMKNMEGVDNSAENWLETALDGGQYNAENNTITWTQNVSNIEAMEEGEEHTVTIEKDITVIYKNISTAKDSTEFTNKLKGSIYFEALEFSEETEEATHTTQTKFVKYVKVNKTWEHGANIYEKPTQLKIKVKNPNTPDAPAIEEAIIGEDNGWTHIFTNLPKYDEETGEEIQYVVEEEAVEGEEELLKYYKQK